MLSTIFRVGAFFMLCNLRSPEPAYIVCWRYFPSAWMDIDRWKKVLQLPSSTYRAGSTFVSESSSMAWSIDSWSKNSWFRTSNRSWRQFLCSLRYRFKLHWLFAIFQSVNKLITFFYFHRPATKRKLIFAFVECWWFWTLVFMLWDSFCCFSIGDWQSSSRRRNAEERRRDSKTKKKIWQKR